MGGGGAHGDMNGGEGMEKMEGMVIKGIQVGNTICEEKEYKGQGNGQDGNGNKKGSGEGKGN